MIIVDRALEKLASEGGKIRVGMVGAGFMSRGIAYQLLRVVPGIRLAAIANRNIEHAERAFVESGVDSASLIRATTQSALDEAVEQDRFAVTEDAMLLCRSPLIDVVIEVTGAVEFGAGVAVEAIDHGKHIVLMNAELDGTVGPILHQRAQRQGVVYTNSDGDQPGVIMNLYRFVKGIGVKPVLCGNIKGLQDPYRNPTTQEAFARQWKQKAHMVTSFADGTKISFEQAIVANGTGMRVAQRGMFGPTVESGTPIQGAVDWYPLAALLDGPGIVDYCVGASPGPGVFVLGTHDDPGQQHYLNLYKLGEGPLYCFHTPYHLCHFEVPMTIARAALFEDAALAPLAGPLVDVVATAKRDLKAGEILDGIGYYMTYGQAENSAVVAREGLLPMGIAEGCRLKCDVPIDAVITMDQVEVPPDRLVDQLRLEQDQKFSAELGVQ